MARRSLFGWFPVAVLAVCTLAACKDKGDATKAQPSAAEVDKRCEQLAKACGDKDKHVTKIIEECKQAATKQTAGGCMTKAIALYDCYEKELCGAGDRVWAIDDLRVLADRYGKCAAEQAAVRDCAKK